MINKLSSNGIPSAVFYKQPFNTSKIYKNKKYYPVSEKISKQILSLPMHPYLKDEDIINISDIVSKS